MIVVMALGQNIGCCSAGLNTSAAFLVYPA
jgi:hypothetical protein